jgi:hypothetical protein
MTLHNDTITGYKVFEPDFTCRDYDFKGVGSTHTYEWTPVLCESGFHFCTTLQDCFKYYNITPHMIVCEVQATGYTDAEEGCSKRTCQSLSIIRQMPLDEVAQHITDSEYAYRWARFIGNKDIMIDRVTESEWAYYWAWYIGNRDTMIDCITDSEWAYLWARDIGNRDIMIDRITESQWAYYWARDIGNKGIMINRIIDSKSYIKRWLAQGYID